jgi:hypothetical protein
VGGVVTDQVERLRVAVGEDRDLGAVGKGGGEVAKLAVDANRQSGLGQPGADCRSRIAPGGAAVQLQRRSVGKIDRDLLSSGLDPAMLPTARRATTPR